MSIWQLVFGIRLSGFVPFGKNYIWDLSIQGNTFEILTLNQVKKFEETNAAMLVRVVGRRETYEV